MMIQTMTKEIDELKKDFLDKFQVLYGAAPEDFKERVYSQSAQKLLELKKKGIPAPVFDCAACKDSKRIRLTNDKNDKLFGQTFWCPECTDENDLVRATGVDNAYKHWTLEQLDFDAAFMRDCVTDLFDNKSIMLFGKVGRGKTHMAVGLVREWIRREKRKPAKFIYFPQFLDDMREMFGDSQQAQQAQQYENRLAKFDLLIIDDLGAERTSDWVVERVNVLLARRMREGRQTIATTNLMDLGEVSQRYGARAASRLGGYRWHECSGIDHRLSS